MKKFIIKYSNTINGYLFILPAFLIIGLFGIFPVFFGMYMSVHKWKVFKGRFLGLENYERILGDISAFSFYSTKMITTGEGGMIATNNKIFRGEHFYFGDDCWGSMWSNSCLYIL